MGGDPGQVHPAGAVLDEEQHIQAAKQHGIDVEEVRRQDRLGLGLQERPPGLADSPGRGVDARVFEDLPHRRRRDLMPRAGQLTIRSRSPSRSLPDASAGAFSSSLTTTVFSQRSMRRLEASLRRATPKGHETFISRTAPHQGLAPTSVLLAFRTHSGTHRAIYTTNLIESMNARLRKVTRNRGQWDCNFDIGHSRARSGQ